MKHLILTIGGSHVPIVDSIKKHNADMNYFICSVDGPVVKGSRRLIDGKGLVCGEPGKEPSLPNIPTQAELPEDKYRIFDIKNPDSLDECYKVCCEAIQQALDEGSNPEYIIPDYTGGTKSMSAGLVLAATDYQLPKFSFVTGLRKNLVRVQNGTGTVSHQDQSYIFCRRAVDEANKLLERYEYRAAADVIEKAMDESSANYRTIMTENRCLCLAMDHWDRFRYEEAAKIIKDLDSYAKDYMPELSALCKVDEDGNPALKACYAMIRDLYHNAKRRAEQGKYDDAISRLYRATELMVQARLRELRNIQTSKVPAELIPKEWNIATGENTFELGLQRSWDLLAHLEPNDIFSKLYKEWRSKILDNLQVRNFSLLAHGFQPLTEESYKICIEKGLGAFIGEGIKILDSEKKLPPASEWPKRLEIEF